MKPSYCKNIQHVTDVDSISYLSEPETEEHLSTGRDEFTWTELEKYHSFPEYKALIETKAEVRIVDVAPER